MENTQKKITGRAPSTYTWEDRTASRSVRRVQPASSKTANVSGRKKNNIAAGLLPWITLAVVVLMIGMIIGKWSAITSYQKMEGKQLKENLEIAGRIDNLRSEYNLEIRSDIIRQKAKVNLGMIEPGLDDDIHVLDNVTINTSDANLAVEGRT